MTVKEALHDSYAGEAKAALRLKLYAKKATDEGYTQMAKLFTVISLSEEIHAIRSLRILKDVKSTEQNLADAFESEKSTAESTYGEFVKLAEGEGNKPALLHFSQSKDVEEIHANLYKGALNHFMEERETTYFLCGFCGFIADGQLPETCPICGFSKDRFVEVK